MSEHLNKIFELEGFITLEQLNDQAKCLSVKDYKAWYQCLNVVSLLKLVTVLSQVVDRREVTEILTKRFEQQQTEIDSLNNSLIDTKRELRLAKKFANLEDSDPF